MTLYFKLVFGFLMTEIAALTVLVSPLPLAVRKRLAAIASNRGVVTSSLAYSVKIILLAVTMFFVDSVNRVRMVTIETEKGKADNRAAMHDVATHTSLMARKTYAQRNMYLTGFCLFLAFLIIRVFALVVGLSNAEETIRLAEASAEQRVQTKAEINASKDHFDEQKKTVNQKATLDKLSEKAY